MRVKCKSPVVASNGLKVETGARKKVKIFKINISTMVLVPNTWFFYEGLVFI